MLDDPSGRLILGEVVSALKAGIPAGFQQHVAANAVALALREGESAEALNAQEHARLVSLVGREGDLDSLNAGLAKAIANGEIALDDAALREHLVLTTIAKMAVDQPNYPAFRVLRADAENA